MTIGASIFLIALGAILRYAVSLDSSAINIPMVGLILMIAGVIGLVVSLFFWMTSNSRRASEEVGPNRQADQPRRN